MAEIAYKGRRLTFAFYKVPCLSKRWITAWWQKHPSWKHGFVIRVGLFGFVIRWGKIPYFQTPRGKLWLAIEQANDGDYESEFF